MTATPSAEAKRSKTKKATPTKSPYFEPDDVPQSEVDDESESAGEEGSDFDEDAEGPESPELDDEDDYESDDEPKKRKNAAQGKGTQAIRTKGNDVWRTGVKAGLGPGNQVVIKKPKARPAGNTPYSDDTIHPNTLLFLSELKANNNREWLKSKFQRSHIALLHALHGANLILLSTHALCTRPSLAL